MFFTGTRRCCYDAIRRFIDISAAATADAMPSRHATIFFRYYASFAILADVEMRHAAITLLMPPRHALFRFTLRCRAQIAAYALPLRRCRHAAFVATLLSCRRFRFVFDASCCFAFTPAAPAADAFQRALMMPP